MAYPRLRCTTPWSRSRRFRAVWSSDHGTAGASVDCAVVELPTARFATTSRVPSSRGEPRRHYAEASPTSAVALPMAARALCRPDSRNRYHRPAYRRWADDSDQCDVIIPDATAGSERVAPHAAIAVPQTPWVGDVRPFVCRAWTSSCRTRACFRASSGSRPSTRLRPTVP